MTYQAQTKAVFCLNKKEFLTVVKRGLKRIGYEERNKLEEAIQMKMWNFAEIVFPCSIPKKKRQFKILPLQDQINVEGHIRFIPFQQPKTRYCREVYVILLDKPTSPQAFMQKKSYRSVAEMKLEIQNKLATYLPPEFDWFSHLGVIEYIEMY